MMADMLKNCCSFKIHLKLCDLEDWLLSALNSICEPHFFLLLSKIMDLPIFVTKVLLNRDRFYSILDTIKL